jgi:hypothetical protein
MHTMKRIIACWLVLAVAAFGQTATAPAQTQIVRTLTGTACITIPIANFGTAVIGVANSGTAWSGTIQPELQVAANTAVNTTVTPDGSTTAQSTITANGSYTAIIAGHDNLLLCGNTVTNTASVTVNLYHDIAINSIPGAGGMVNPGTATQLAYYASSTNAVSADSALTDNASTLTYTGANGVASPSYTANGTGAGNLGIGQGITVPGTTLPANSFNLSGQNSITTYQSIVPGASGGGIWFNTVASPATLTAVMVSNQLSSVTINSGGGSPNPYAVAPSVQVTGGSCTTEPAVTLSISGGVVNGYTIVNAGAGCTGTPALNVVPQDVISFVSTGTGVTTFLTTPSTTNLASAVTAANAAGTFNVASTTTYNGTSSGTTVVGCIPIASCASGFGSTTVNSVWKMVTSGSAGGGVAFDDESAGFTTSAMTNQTTATCTPITNMSWSISASKDYILRCQIPRTLAATATLQYCLNGPGTPTSYSLDVQGANGTSGAWSDINLLASTTYGTKTTASVAAANTAVDNIYAFIQNGSTGSGTALTLQTAANGTNAITVLANASCTLTQVN